MAYRVNGKFYTDHPLMDEIVYYMGIILNQIEIKDTDMADKYESEEQWEASSTFLGIKDGTMVYDTFPFTEKYFEAYGFTKKQAKQFVVDRQLVPDKEKDNVFKFACDKFLEEYVETNNYYRALIGLPWIEEFEPEDKYWVYIDETYVPDEPYLEGVIDYSKPLHEYDNYQIAVLTYTGAFDRIYKEYTGRRYKYLHFLGDTKRNLYDVRRATKWDILYLPSVDTMVADRFKQIYFANRTLYLNRFYSEAHKYGSDYYDQVMIVMLLCQTYTDMITDIPEWYVRRDVFDLRTCQLFLESHGIEFYKVIPLKYQVRLVKNMNKLIKYKSTNKNIWDIIDIFDIADTTVYKYYLFKKRIANEEGSYVHGKDPSEEYELEFIKAPIGTSYDDTIKDNIYRTPYDDLTYYDKWWDGEDTHENVKTAHMNKDFTIEGTKYISLDNKVDMSQYAFQIEYFFGLIFDSDMELGDIKISLPMISHLVSLPISDIFLLLYCLTGLYDNYKLLIRTPVNDAHDPKPEFHPYDDWDGGYTNNRNPDYEVFGGGPEVKQKYRMPLNGGDVWYSEINQESYHDWINHYHPYIWMDMTHRMMGFNMKADLDELQDLIGFRHSKFGFWRGYTLEEIGVDGFLTTRNIDSIDMLVKVYQTNAIIHDELHDKIMNAQTRDERLVLQFVFDYLFTREFDYKRYTLRNTGELAYDLSEVLRERNYVIYQYYKKIMMEADEETRRDMIRDAMNDIINTLEYYISADFLKYIFAVFTTTSFTNLLNYMALMINFFKSYKVYMIEIKTTFITNNKMDNGVNIMDGINQIEYHIQYPTTVKVRDTYNTTVSFDYIEMGTKTNIVEVMEFYPYYSERPLLDLEIDGGTDPEVIDTIVDEGEDVFTDNTAVTLRDLDGGGVDVLSHAPFRQFDGGTIGNGKHMLDINGAYPVGMSSYIDLDGGHAKPIPEKHYLNFKLSYDVDGGRVHIRKYLSKTLIIRQFDNKIRFDVRLHDRPWYWGVDMNNSTQGNIIHTSVPNMIEILDDGLYIKDDYVFRKDARLFRSNMEQFIQDLTDIYDDIIEASAGCPSQVSINLMMKNIIQQLKDSIIPKGSGSDIDISIRNTLETCKKYIDKKTEELEEWWKYNYQSPFSWGSF